MTGRKTCLLLTAIREYSSRCKFDKVQPGLGYKDGVILYKHVDVTSFQPPRLIRWWTCTSKPFAGFAVLRGDESQIPVTPDDADLTMYNQLMHLRYNNPVTKQQRFLQ
jgi:hypothetical protein